MHRRARPRVALSAERLEDRVNPVSFSTLDGYWLGGNVMSVAVGDLNGDGFPDIAAGDAENGVEILLNDGTGEFVHGETLPIGAPFHVEFADLNNDGKLDLYATTEWGQRFYTAIGKGDGTFQVAVGRELTTDTRGAAPADFNGDGKLDMVVADTDGAAVYLYNGSTSLYSAPTFYHPDPSAGAFGVAAGDFNGDGKSDFALIEYSAQRLDVFLNHGDGTFGAPTHYANIVPNNGRTILARDFNNDGILDLITGYEDTSYLGLYFGNGDGTFQDPVGVNTSLTRNGPFAATDFDLDGNLDLVVMRAFDGDESVFLGDGAGGFSSGTMVIDSWSGGVATGDVNGDGLPDIVTGHSLSPGLVSISINTTPIVSALEISAPSTVNAGDPFNVTVTARDGNGAILTGYAGLVHFTSTDNLAQLPADAHLTNGVGSFMFTMLTDGIQTITVADAALPNVSATTSPISVSNLNTTPTVVASFPALGLYRTSAPRGWSILTRMHAEHIVASANGQTLLADFGINGLWRWNAAGLNRLTPANVQSAVISLDGRTIVADFGANGLKRWTESGGWVQIAGGHVESLRLSNDGQTVVADFGRGGLRRWIAGTGWATLSESNPAHVVVDATGQIVVGDFGSRGLWRWTSNSTGWERLSSMNAENVVLSADGSTVVADFGARGLRRWTESGRWVTLSRLNAESVSISYDGKTILADFGSNGLRRWVQTLGWTRLSTANVDRAILSLDGRSVAADFGNGGLWIYSAGWTLLSTLNADLIAIG